MIAGQSQLMIAGGARPPEQPDAVQQTGESAPGEAAAAARARVKHELRRKTLMSDNTRAPEDRPDGPLPGPGDTVGLRMIHTQDFGFCVRQGAARVFTYIDTALFLSISREAWSRSRASTTSR